MKTRTLTEVSHNQDDALLMAIKNHLQYATAEQKATAQDDVISILNNAILADSDDCTVEIIESINNFIIDNISNAKKCPYCGSWFFADDDEDAGGQQYNEQENCCVFCIATQNY